MVMVGTDVHKYNHCAQAVDELGRPLAAATSKRLTPGTSTWSPGPAASSPAKTSPAPWRTAGRCRPASNAPCSPPGSGSCACRPKLIAGARASARTRGKSDPIDALAVARAALREPNLPVAVHDTASREVKLLVDHRENLVATRVQAQNRLRWHLHELDPELDPPARGLDSVRLLDKLAAWLAGQLIGVTAHIATELVADIKALTLRIRDLERELDERVQAQVPQLLELQGCGVLSAAKLLAETANVTRFRSEACFAMHAGVAPIPASSGRTDRHRRARGGNRQLNAALHRIALTQSRLEGPSREYYYDAEPAGTATATRCAPSNDASPGSSSACSSRPAPPLPYRKPPEVAATRQNERPPAAPCYLSCLELDPGGPHGPREPRNIPDRPTGRCARPEISRPLLLTRGSCTPGHRRPCGQAVETTAPPPTPQPRQPNRGRSSWT